MLANTASSISQDIKQSNATHSTNNRKENVINLSDYNPTVNELEVLSLGLNFAIPPTEKLTKNLKLKFISSIEANFNNEDMEEVEKEITRRNICKLIEQGRSSKPNKEILQTIKSLTDNKNIVILKADKGNATVIMNTIDYHNKIKQLIEDGPYSIITEDPTEKILKNLKSICKRLKDSNRIDKDLYNEMINCNPRISKFFGLPKIHKEGIPFRPINDYRNSTEEYNYIRSNQLITVAMKKRFIAIFVWIVGGAILFTLYSFSDSGVHEMQPTKVHKIEGKMSNYEKSEWPFEISKNYNESEVVRWSYPVPIIHNDSYQVGQGGGGYVPSADKKELMEQLIKEHNFNLLASDLMSLHRSVPDSRSHECKSLKYPEKLPTTSVVIIFHNEAWSTLLRTVWSVIDRSPPELLKEIVLVDDFSTWTFLKRPLDDYIETLPVNLKLIRNAKREGLIRARLIGAKEATGSVLTFLDAHMECNEGWLQPLLERIASDRSVVAVPTMDQISSDNMSYQYNKDVQINGFHWNLIFNW
ncbi:Polypeptide N-acetylgalactosaminyltransferase 5 [Pseudolycoriella hygida]|uniref:Polypeptide N-acetylgalactosaminyltransferase 5 n=1 Tax=Pseudolycoriella hygida TaxID=35572 RepID=A0A9Q0MPU3_9DIPT|nr:Polypeptide N-acetylgalactosaminyltransferase 5 [Pseudolycoriella hygida]